MRALRPGLSAVLAAVILSLFFSGLSAPTPANAATADISTIYAETNAARTSAGLRALRHNTAMNAVAQAWAKQMAVNNSMSHNPNYSSQIPSGWSRASENVAYGYTSGTVVDAWLNSPGHRANIMGDVTDVGIGYFVDAEGVAWSVQNFAKYATSTAPAPSTQPVSGPTPKITGTLRVGQKVTAIVGTWTPSPVTLSYQWKRGGANISGATGKSYTLRAADAGRTITVAVTGKKANFSTVTKVSAKTAGIRAK
jgi:hypothetical protein